MTNEMMFQLFQSTIAKMNDAELNNALQKAKGLLSENDYNNLLNYIQKERNRRN